MHNLLCFSRNRCTAVERIDEHTLKSQCRLQDTTMDARVDITVHMPDLDITDVTGTVQLPEGVEMVMPGDNIQMEIKVISPVAMEKGQRFAIREGGRTIGAGRISEIMD